jgi:hypothetical protein
VIKEWFTGGGGGVAGLPIGLLMPNRLVTRFENISFPVKEIVSRDEYNKLIIVLLYRVVESF